MSAQGQGSGSPAAVGVVEPEDPGWSRFLAERPEATCFHQPSWLATLTGTYGLRTFVAVQRDDAGEIVAGLPLAEVRRPLGARRWSSLPFSDECGPLVARGGSVATLGQHVDALRRAHDVADLEVRTRLDLPGVCIHEVAVTHALPLRARGDGGTPLAGARASVRRHVATSRRQGVQVHVAEGVGDVVGTYYRLHVQTRRRQGVPAQPRSYFRLLWERMLEPGHGFVLIARRGGSAVAGAVYLLGGRTVTYKYGASDARSWSLRPNHAVMAEAIRWATEHGYRTFDFGRTDLDNPGLAQFKQSWGAEARPLRYTSFSGSPRYGPGHPAQAMVAPLIRRAPTMVCRGLGELLYRYAA